MATDRDPPALPTASLLERPRHIDACDGVLLFPVDITDVHKEILAESRAAEARILAESLTANTRRSYASHLRSYLQWVNYFADTPVLAFRPVGSVQLRVLLTNMLDGVSAATAGKRQHKGPPPKTVKARTVFAWCAAIRHAYLTHGYPDPFTDPDVAALLRSARRGLRHQGPPKKRAPPMCLDVLKQLVDVCLAEKNLEGLRDAALLLVAFASGGRRRSELAALQVEDIAYIAHATAAGEPGYQIRLAHLKGHDDALPECVPILGAAHEVLKTWLHGLGQTGGPLFRKMENGRVHPTQGLNGLAIWRLVKRRAAQAGYAKAGFSPHSLRSGYLTECGLKMIPIDQAAHLSKHSNLDTARGYQQLGTHFDNPAAQLTRDLVFDIPMLPPPGGLLPQLAYNLHGTNEDEALP
jgi:integrase